MKRLIAISLSFTNALIAYAGYLSPCEIEGINQNEWYYGKQLLHKIPDTQEGPFIEFNTKNIVGIKEQTSTYLNATYKDNVLQLHPNLKFKSFEEDYEDGISTLLEITIILNCIQNSYESIKFLVRIEDINEHVPIFDRSVYEYHFGMDIPEDYHLTDILPISVVDRDFTNNQIYFTIEYNTILRLEHHGKRKNYDDNYFTTIKTLAEIKAPFKEEFTIVATDSGVPPKKSTAHVILTVSSNQSSTQRNNDFIFSKSVYMARYLPSYLLIQEPIKLGCPSELDLQQYGFANNFKIELKPSGIVQITQLQPLPDTIRSLKSFIAIDLEATCDSFTEQSSLIISFMDDRPRTIISSLNTFYNSYTGSTFVIYMSALVAFVFLNMKVFYLYFQKRHKKCNTSLPL